MRASDQLPRLRDLICAALLTTSVCACSDGGGTSTPPMLGVLSAFPGESAPVVALARVDEKIVIDGHVFRKGVLGGVPVVIGMTGIGLVNAANTTRLMLDNFDVKGVVVSAVAGSSVSIGDVVVPTTWQLSDGTSYDCYLQWLDIARRVAASKSAALENCTTVPDVAGQVCIPAELAVIVGGVGQSADPFNNQSVQCHPNIGDVFGCDIEDASGALAAEDPRRSIAPHASQEAEAPIVEDMETAAIAREVTSRGLPFIAFRAVSDGADDPLGLPGFPVQFYAYYHLAAHNAAAATVAFLQRLSNR